jgi:hypothetical protein
MRSDPPLALFIEFLDRLTAWVNSSVGALPSEMLHLKISDRSDRFRPAQAVDLELRFGAAIDRRNLIKSVVNIEYVVLLIGSALPDGAVMTISPSGRLASTMTPLDDLASATLQLPSSIMCAH